MADLIKIAEEAFATGKQTPAFKAGDTVTVAYKIVEGNKERVQLYRGVVIKISGHGDKKRFTVRKMSGTVGVERIFPIESPAIESIEVNKVGKVRRATTSATSRVRRHASRKSVPPSRRRHKPHRTHGCDANGRPGFCSCCRKRPHNTRTKTGTIAVPVFFCCRQRANLREMS